MDKAEFQALEIADQVKYINSVESLSKAGKQLGISKGIGDKFKKHGYILQNGKYKLQQIAGQEIILNVKPSQKPRKEPIKKVEPVSDINTLPEEEAQKPLKTLGRPPRKGREKTNITLDAEVKTELQIYCLRQRISLSDLLEQLAIEFLGSIRK